MRHAEGDALGGEPVERLIGLGQLAYGQAGIPAFDFGAENDPPLIAHNHTLYRSRYISTTI